MGESRGLVPGIRQGKGSDQAVAQKLAQYRAQGAIPVFLDKRPAAPRIRGLPITRHRQVGEHGETKEGCKRGGAILLISTASIGTEATLMCTPSMLTAEKLPDMTLPRDSRLISDVRLFNAWCDKYDYPPVETPRLDSPITHIWQIRRNYH